MRRDLAAARRELEEQERRRLLAAMEDERRKHRRLMAEAAQRMAEAKQAYDHLAWVVGEIRRQHQKDFYEPMRKAIETMYRCESRHVTTYAVRKVAEGRTLWDGYVEEFALIGHHQASACYAWYYEEWRRTQSFTVLRLPPIHSPQNAVQLALTARKLLPAEPL